MNKQAEGFAAMIHLLRRLQGNNSKEWMDANRKEYISVRDFFVNWLDEMNLLLAEKDPEYFDTPGKKGIPGGNSWVPWTFHTLWRDPRRKIAEGEFWSHGR